jgi:hypothetical protein
MMRRCWGADGGSNSPYGVISRLHAVKPVAAVLKWVIARLCRGPWISRLNTGVRNGLRQTDPRVRVNVVRTRC